MVLAGCLASTLALADDTRASTTQQAEVKRLPGGAILRTSPGARLTIEKPMRLQLGSASAPKTLAQTVTLISGRLEIQLPEKKTPTTAVLVRTPHDISAVAKGGRSVIMVSGESSTVAAYSGEMLVASQDRWRTLDAGVVREFRRGGGHADHPVMAAPSLALSAPIALQLSDARASLVSATLTPVPGARSYEFGIWRTGQREPTLLHRLASERATLELPPLEPGTYAISARGVEASGLEGPESEPMALRVVRAELPEGARLSNRAIVMKPHQRVQLHGTEGLEISYDQLRWFSSAPNSVGLYRGQPTLVRLRAKGSSHELAFTLEPHTVLAEIELGPRRAQWPADEVRVAVRVSDARGRPLPETDAGVKPVVTVNRALVPLEWKRAENALTAVVPRPTSVGPWVVRVELLDDTGRLVARDFLEVAAEDEPATRARAQR